MSTPFSWQSFAQDLALYVVVGVVAYFARKYGLRIDRGHNQLHQKISEVDAKLSQLSGSERRPLEHQ